jgi:hypothetical protein
MPKTIAGRNYIFLWKKTRENDKPPNKKGRILKNPALTVNPVVRVIVSVTRAPS